MSDWTKKDFEKIRELRRDGRSVSQIAKIFGREYYETRSAVVKACSENRHKLRKFKALENKKPILLRMLKEGYRIEKISNLFGCSHVTIRDFLKENKIEYSPKKGFIVPPPYKNTEHDRAANFLRRFYSNIFRESVVGGDHEKWSVDEKSRSKRWIIRRAKQLGWKNET